MEKYLKAVVVIPDEYRETGRRFPVFYLLHGWSGSFRDWITHTDLGAISDRYQLIIVCPDGGYAGWYVDSPIDSGSQFDRHISEEVINYIDSNFRTIQEDDYRFICGLSMGGHGAISLLAKHPDLFCGAGSMSGVMDLLCSSKRYGINELLGNYDDNKERWRENSCIYLVHRLVGKGKLIIIDCGVNDAFIEINRKMHNELLLHSIAHDYYERPGGHSWEYWINALEYHVIFFKKHLEKIDLND